MPTRGRNDPLFRALGRSGISRDYVRNMLPDWWTDELLDSPSARVELEINLSRMFGLSLSNLLADKPTVTFDLPDGTKFKRSHRIAVGELAQATSIVNSTAKMVAACVSQKPVAIPDDPLRIRAEILEGGAKWVSLMAVIKYLWLHGVPTIYLSELPPGMKKMDGMVLQVDGRPVVVLCKRTTQAAWLLFILAHELAHVALGHVGAGEVLVDCVIGEESYLFGEGDPEETAADSHAIALLNGNYGTRYTTNLPPKPAPLAKAALDYQKEHGVDAGHILLNYGFHKSAWPVAQAALRLFPQQDAPLRVNEFFFQSADFRGLPESSVDYLLKISGMDSVLEFGGPAE